MDQDIRPGIPNGWYAVAWSKELAVGEVKRVFCFEEELVLFRTRSGKARVLSAYCSHIGAHLAEGGRVVVPTTGRKSSRPEIGSWLSTSSPTPICSIGRIPPCVQTGVPATKQEEVLYTTLVKL